MEWREVSKWHLTQLGCIMHTIALAARHGLSAPAPLGVGPINPGPFWCSFAPAQNPALASRAGAGKLAYSATL